MKSLNLKPSPVVCFSLVLSNSVTEHNQNFVTSVFRVCELFSKISVVIMRLLNANYLNLRKFLSLLIVPRVDTFFK